MPRRPVSPAASTPTAPGAFLSDGRFVEEASASLRGHIDGLVRAMVKARRTGELTPGRAADVIVAANAMIAFPMAEQWRSAGSWALCHTSTPAEEAVKRAGRGTEGHWCGDSWASGREGSCEDLRHRPMSMTPGQWSELQNALSSVGAGPRKIEADLDSPPPPE